MNINLKTLSITNYDSNDLEKVRFVGELKEDPLIHRYLYDCIDEMIKKSKSSNNLTVGYGYIVESNKKLVGFLRPARLEDKYTLDLDYGVYPSHRKKGYGTKILLEVSDYLLENIDGINKIKLSINSNNIYSIKCALEAGFIKSAVTDVYNFQIYLKRRGSLWK